jgi:hypothetical protein
MPSSWLFSSCLAQFRHPGDAKRESYNAACVFPTSTTSFRPISSRSTPRPSAPPAGCCTSTERRARSRTFASRTSCA